MTANSNENPRDFASGYATSHRVYEIAGMVGCTVTFTTLAVKLATSEHLSGWWAPLPILVGLLAADFISGFVHWLCDTWGSIDTPILGQLAIRSFREHHVDPKSITRHDFVEVNGHNAALSIVPSVGGLFAIASGTMFSTHVALACLSMAFFVAITSQVHKWSHLDKPPSFIRVLQDSRLILSIPHHDKHHQRPYDKYFCITVGWLNGPLQAIRFFQTLERAITRVTGRIPRQDDIGTDEALAVVAATQVEHANTNATAATKSTEAA